MTVYCLWAAAWMLFTSGGDRQLFVDQRAPASEGAVEEKTGEQPFCKTVFASQ